MKLLKMALALAVVAASSTSAFAGSVVLNLNGLQNLEPIENYLNGGFGGNGSGPGPNDGVVFSDNSLAIISESMGGTGNFDNNPSGGPIAFFLNGTADTMDVAAGFNTGFSFFYSGTQPGFVTVYSGLDETGSILASLSLSPNTPGAGCPTGDPFTYCEWDPVGVSFAGTAMSVDFGGSANFIGFDEITLNSATPGVPEPNTLLLLGSGLAGLAGMLRRKLALR